VEGEHEELRSDACRDSKRPKCKRVSPRQPELVSKAQATALLPASPAVPSS
jgi:hypothetical protein